jgi:hypothetical protein
MVVSFSLVVVVSAVLQSGTVSSEALMARIVAHPAVKFSERLRSGCVNFARSAAQGTGLLHRRCREMFTR